MGYAVRLKLDAPSDQITIPLGTGRLLKASTLTASCITEEEFNSHPQWLEIVGECDDETISINGKKPVVRKTKNTCCGKSKGERVMCTLINHSSQPALLFGGSSGETYGHRKDGEQFKVLVEDVQHDTDKFDVL